MLSLSPGLIHCKIGFCTSCSFCTLCTQDHSSLDNLALLRPQHLQGSQCLSASNPLPGEAYPFHAKPSKAPPWDHRAHLSASVFTCTLGGFARWAMS